MWLHLTLLLLVGAAVAEHEFAWKTGYEYQFLLQSQTVTKSNLNELSSNQYNGLYMEGVLVVQVKSPNLLYATICKPEYASVQTAMADGSESDMPDGSLQYMPIPLTGKTFEIKTKNGVVKDLLVQKDVYLKHNWEVNLLKSVVSQLQVDTLGENMMQNKNYQLPDNDFPFGYFMAMEDTVGGKCEVLYDIMEVSTIHNMPPVPMSDLPTDGNLINLTKTKNYTNCEQQMSYQFGFKAGANWKSEYSTHGEYLSRNTHSHISISGSLEQFTIYSSVTTNEIYVGPNVPEDYMSSVYNKMNLTLTSVNMINELLPVPEDLMSMGNLVYNYNNPYPLPQKSSDNLYSPRTRLDSSRFTVSSEEKQTPSSEKRDYLQPRPEMNKPPHIPFLPYFIGYMGMNIQQSDQIYVVKEAKDLVDHISKELKNPNEIPAENTMEKFLNLIELVQLMSDHEILELENSLLLSPNQIKNNDDDLKDTYWHVLRDAVTQAGTGPALQIITHWVHDDLLKGKDAADVFSRIPQTALIPTEKYVETFFNLISDKKVMEQKFLNETAPLAFAELVYNTYVKSHHNHYPVDSFDRMIPKQLQEKEVKRYMTYFALHMQDGFSKGDSTYVHTYIAALGNIAHPNILYVYEPYLEGQYKASKFQCLMMVSALSKLAEVNPDSVRDVLFKLYLNIKESYEVRVMAVYLLMKTNPSLTMLERMAKYTYYDPHIQVISAVKSIIKSYATLKKTEWKDISQKARIVEKLLTTETYNNASHAYITDNVKFIDQYLYEFAYYTIDSEDSNIPKALFTKFKYNLMTHYNNEFKYMVSNVNKFFETIDIVHKPKDKDSYKKSYKNIIESIVRSLNIQSDDHEPLEGYVSYHDHYAFQFLPFDNNTIQLYVKNFHKYLDDMKEGKHINMNKLENYYKVLAMPTETGIPFFATVKVPKLIRVNGDLEAQQNDDGSIFKMKGHLDAVYSEKMQMRTGFVSPFSHHSYVIGVDTNLQLYWPANYQFEVDSNAHTIQFNVQPATEVAAGINLLHYSKVPYSASQNILDLQPMSHSKDTYMVLQNKPYKETYSFASDMIKIKLEGGVDPHKNTYNKMKWESYLISYMGSIFSTDYNYKKIEVYLYPDKSSYKNNWYGLSAAYDTAEVNTDVLEQDQSQTKRINIPVVSDKQPLSQMRRKLFIQELGEDMNSAKVHVLDVALEIPSKTSQNRQVLTLGLANNNVNKKSRSLLYWNIQSMESDDVYLEACAAGQMQSSQDILLDFEKAIRSEPKDEFNGELRIGKSCTDGKTISLKGKQTRTNERKSAVLQSKIAKKCQEEMRKDNKGLRACEIASKLAAQQNQLEMSLELDPTLSNTYLNKVVQSVSDKMGEDSNMELSNPRNADRNTLEARMEASPDYKKVQISLHTPQMNVTLPWQDLSPMKLLLPENDPDRLMEKEDKASCTLDKKRAVTFDDRSYPLNLGKCWHVMMITSPQENPANPDELWTMSQKTKMLVLVREMDNNSKQVRIILGDNEIYLEQLNQQKCQCKVNGQTVRYSQHVSYQHKEDNQTTFEMFELMDGSIRLMSTKYEMNAVYDGYRLRVEVSDAYRKPVRGLCGNYDAQPDNDFMTPRKCLLNKPEEFSATYALLQDDCQGPAKENARKAEQSNCMYLRTRQANVISDKEAGRTMRENEKKKSENPNTQQKNCSSYRTTVIQRNGQICFTTRPLPMCMDNCKPTEMKMKSYSVHCMSDNETSRQLQSKIEQGANPDMSQRSVSMMIKFEIPVACNAA